MYSTSKMNGSNESGIRNHKYLLFIAGSLFCLLLYFTFIYRNEVVELREKTRYNTFLLKKSKITFEKTHDELKICQSQRQSVDSAVRQLQRDATKKDTEMQDYQSKIGKYEQLGNRGKEFFDTLKNVLYGRTEQLDYSSENTVKITTEVEKLKADSEKVKSLEERLEKLSSDYKSNEDQISNYLSQNKILEEKLDTMSKLLLQVKKDKKDLEDQLKESKLKRGFTIKKESLQPASVRRIDLNKPNDEDLVTKKTKDRDSTSRSERKQKPVVVDDEDVSDVDSDESSKDRNVIKAGPTKTKQESLKKEEDVDSDEAVSKQVSPSSKHDADDGDETDTHSEKVKDDVDDDSDGDSVAEKKSSHTSMMKDFEKKIDKRVASEPPATKKSPIDLLKNHRLPQAISNILSNNVKNVMDDIVAKKMALKKPEEKPVGSTSKPPMPKVEKATTAKPESKADEMFKEEDDGEENGDEGDDTNPNSDDADGEDDTKGWT